MMGNTSKAKRMVMEFSHTRMAIDTKGNGVAINFGGLELSLGLMGIGTRVNGLRIRKMAVDF